MSVLNDFKTWNEAATWLARHGYGLGSIQDLKIEWDQAHTPTLIEEASILPEPVAAVTPEPVVEEPEILVAASSEINKEVIEETAEE
jgi:hypothetical protein